MFIDFELLDCKLLSATCDTANFPNLRKDYNMKTHAIIPIFIPHKGCPHDCVFCNQKKITARLGQTEPDDVREIIENHLKTLENRGIETIEAAFFGGSFTGIPIEEQSSYLSIASEYKEKGRIHKIHLSTRPDYINEAILKNLKEYGTDIIELGVQSFDEEVLKASNRGHDSKIVYESCKLIKEYGFELGIQLMIGLPKDTRERAVYSAREAVKISPSVVRLYPTVIIEDTELLEMYKNGKYKGLELEEAVSITKEMYKIIDEAGIKIIRVGLKSTDIIRENGSIIGNAYHPAFRQLVEGEIAKERLESQLEAIYTDLPEGAKVTFESNGTSFSNMIGNKKCNKVYFCEKYGKINIKFGINPSLANKRYNVIVL